MYVTAINKRMQNGDYSYNQSTGGQETRWKGEDNMTSLTERLLAPIDPTFVRLRRIIFIIDICLGLIKDTSTLWCFVLYIFCTHLWSTFSVSCRRRGGRWPWGQTTWAGRWRHRWRRPWRRGLKLGEIFFEKSRIYFFHETKFVQMSVMVQKNASFVKNLTIQPQCATDFSSG